VKILVDNLEVSCENRVEIWREIVRRP